jgi:hypothetical protein
MIKVRIETFDDKIQSIAELMGGTVTSRDTYHFRIISLPEGMAIRLIMNNDTQFGIIGEYPRTVDNFPLDPGCRKCIGISVQKTPESIIRDIERRFMPQYKADFQAALKRKAERDAICNAIANKKAELLARGFTPLPHKADGNTVCGCGATIRVHSDCYSFEMNFCNDDLSGKIIDLLIAEDR